jgi:hypothetical protein
LFLLHNRKTPPLTPNERPPEAKQIVPAIVPQIQPFHVNADAEMIPEVLPPHASMRSPTGTTSTTPIYLSKPRMPLG